MEEKAGKNLEAEREKEGFELVFAKRKEQIVMLLFAPKPNYFSPFLSPLSILDPKVIAEFISSFFLESLYHE